MMNDFTKFHKDWTIIVDFLINTEVQIISVHPLSKF